MRLGLSRAGSAFHGDDQIDRDLSRDCSFGGKCEVIYKLDKRSCDAKTSGLM